MVTKKQTPSVFDYLSYRAYLRDMYAFLKRARKGFSYRSFSRAAGFKSQSVLKQLIDGERNLADDSIARVAVAAKRPRLERRSAIPWSSSHTPLAWSPSNPRKTPAATPNRGTGQHIPR